MAIYRHTKWARYEKGGESGKCLPTCTFRCCRWRTPRYRSLLNVLKSSKSDHNSGLLSLSASRRWFDAFCRRCSSALLLASVSCDFLEGHTLRLHSAQRWLCNFAKVIWAHCGWVLIKVILFCQWEQVQGDQHNAGTLLATILIIYLILENGIIINIKGQNKII